MATENKFAMFKRGGTEPVAYLAEAAWNLREWQREVVGDSTLETVLRFFLPGIRRKVELSTIDAGLVEQATKLPGEEDISAAAIIAFVEELEFVGGTRIQIPAGPAPPESQWRTLSRARAQRIAMQWVDENGDKQVDWQDETQVAKLEGVDAFTLAQLWDACELIAEREPPAFKHESGSGQADSKTDNENNSWPKLPDNPDVIKLAKRIRDDPDSQRSRKDIALEFTEGNPKQAESLLRQLRRFPHLLNRADSADK